MSKFKKSLDLLGFKKYFFNTSWMLIERLLRILIGIFFTIWIARYFGPEVFGVYSYVLAFAAIFSGIARLGLDELLVRELVNNPIKDLEILGTAFWLKLIGGIITFSIAALILVIFSDDQQVNLLILIILSGLVFQSADVIEFYFQSKVLAKFISICKIAQILISSLVKAFLLIYEFEIIWLVSVFLFDAFILGSCFLIAFVLIKNKFFFYNFNIDFAKKLLSNSWPLILSTIVTMIYMRIDQLMIRSMLGDYEVGIYSISVRLSEAAYFIPIIISASLFPAILNAKKTSSFLYEIRMQRLYCLLAWIAISIGLVTTFLSENIISALFGKDYIESSKVLVIHIWSSIFVFVGVAYNKYLISENLTSVIFKRTFLGAIVNILLNIIFIPIYGIIGAAISTLIAQFFANFFYDIFEKRLHKQLEMKLKSIFMPWKIVN